MAGEDTAEFNLKLQDGVSGPASSAASALEKFREKIDGDTRALSSMQAAMKRLQGGSSVNIQAFKELQQKIDRQKQSIAESTAKYVELGGTFNKVAKPAKKSGEALSELGKAASKMPGPLGRIASSLSNAGGGMTFATGAALGLAAAVVAVTVAVVAATGALARFGLESANARRAEMLHFEGIEHMRRGYMRARASAGEVMTAIAGVSATSAASRGQISSLAEILHRGGLRGANLTTALRAAAIKTSVLGDASGTAFARMAVGANRAGVSVSRLAADVQARFGNIAARQMLDLNVMGDKLRESFTDLFSGLNIEPILRGINTITQLFSQNTATGKALKALVEIIFQPLIDGAAEGTPIVKRFFQGMVIAALKVVIVLLTLRNWFKRTFGDATSHIDGAKVALYAGIAVIGLFALMLLPIATAALMIYLQFRLISSVIGVVARGFNAIRGFGRSLLADWRGIGPQIINGLIQGLTSGASRLGSAMRSLATTMLNALKEALDIHSPSRVFATVGLQIPRGVEMGVDRGANDLNASISDMISVPEFGAAAGAVPAARAGQTITVQLMGDIHVHTQATNAESIAISIRDELAAALEGLSIQMEGD